MAVHLGIDLGTSSVKCVVLDEHASVVATSQVPYAVHRDHAGWAEQSPDAWWSATVHAIHRATAGAPTATIGSVGLSGQMHGLVLLDRAGIPVRPAIIWPDARSGAEVELWREQVGDDFVTRTCGMPIATGIAALSLTWLRRHEPAALSSARWVMQPKDYLRLRLTGERAIEPTDACASLLLAVDDARPVPELLELSGIDESMLPRIVPTLSTAGSVSAAASTETGLRPGIPVAAGGGDQAMAALGLGLDGFDRAAVAISSGGTAVMPTRRGTTALGDGARAHHMLAGPVAGEQLAMSVVLAAGLATQWLARDMLQNTRSEADLLDAAARIPPGADGLVATPHLGGTRTPVVDARPQGGFLGLGYHHSPAHLMRGMVDGIALSLTQALAAMADADVALREIVLSGGGARFPVWGQAIADASGLPVVISSDVEHSAIGAALAGAAAADVDLPFHGRSRIRGRVDPRPADVAAYRDLAERSERLRAALA